MKRIIDNGKLPPTPQSDLDKYYGRKFNLTAFLFDKQLAFVEDPAPFKVAVCSRRSGKTTACVAHLIHTAINNSNSVCLYITLSADQAKRNVWREVKKINDKYKLGGKLNEVELSITFENGAIVYLSGAKDASQIEKFRGLAIKLCYIDECQSFREYIQDLIDDVVAPALLDYAGTLCLIGTPGPVPAGYFYDCSVTNENWSKHGWTFWDNPFIPITAGMTHQAVFDREMRRKGVGIDDPSTQREFFGKWILDGDSLLVKYDKVKNNFTDLPEHLTKYHYIMGIDVGFKDADAISILAYSDSSPTTYLIDELITTKQGITELVEQIQTLSKQYNVNKMVMDFGGLGKKIGEEIIKRYGIPVEAADKARKMENVELLNDALRTSRFKAKPTSRFAQDSYRVEIDRDKSTPERIKVSDRYHSDIIDSVLYAFKFSPAYAYTKPKEGPKWGTKEWADQEHDEMWEKELTGHIKANELAKYENGEF